ncbi:hypothetical protein [Agrobacterium tumefaciens]|uniref:hypothetical protein n=1 Tax=Agrobacterium tumefaciens TaxID=358 RepID=UPI001F29F6C5|nr:hypothetical protein [Agrobacterium tumefaciens]
MKNIVLSALLLSAATAASRYIDHRQLLLCIIGFRSGHGDAGGHHGGASSQYL